MSSSDSLRVLRANQLQLLKEKEYWKKKAETLKIINKTLNKTLQKQSQQPVGETAKSSPLYVRKWYEKLPFWRIK